MQDQKLNLQGGVLIIGSLLWQNNLGNNQNYIRKNWRINHLIETKKMKVYASIRYGRKSTNGIYTMTFSNSANRAPGTAWVLPFKQNPINSLDMLLKEAKELSEAEGMKQRFITRNKENEVWAVLGILLNHNKIDPSKKNKLIDWWQKQLKSDENYDLFNYRNFRLGSEKPCILQNGLLNFPWINSVNIEGKAVLDDFDFLLGTATLPTPIKYPSINKMIENVKADNVRLYFRNNNKNEITTFQDERILKKINIKNI